MAVLPPEGDELVARGGYGSHETTTARRIPFHAGDRLLAVLEVRGERPGAFDDQAMRVLDELSAQVALVIQNEELRGQERITLARLRELDELKVGLPVRDQPRAADPGGRRAGVAPRAVNDELTPGQAGEFLDAAHRRAEELAALVEDLLEVSKVADRPPRVRRADVDIEQAVLSALVRVPERIRSRLRVDVRPVGAHVRSDPYHLQQILGRLVDNALKFSERPVDVRIEVTDADLWVSTEDRGVGIPAEQLPFLFERFRQGEGALRRASDGVGLGLFVVRRLVEELGGTIDVTSTPGVGSTFTVQLPLVGAREAGREARSARA